MKNSKEYKAAVESQKRLKKALDKFDAVLDEAKKEIEKFNNLKTK